MSLHDAYARMTPYEIAFPDEDAVERLARDAAAEAAGRGVDPTSPTAFITLGAVADFIRRLKGPDGPEGTLHQYGALLFQAVHFVEAGRPLYLLEAAATRYLVGGSPGGDPYPPASAGYLQLPQHLFWMGDSDGDTPESIDGIFWFATDAGLLHAVPITGVLPDRPGFRALPLPEAPLEDARHWLDAEMREGAADYSSSLPGHDLDRLYSVRNAGEVLKLLARFFAYLKAVPEAGAHAAGHAEAADGPRPSGLPYTRVQLVA